MIKNLLHHYLNLTYTDRICNVEGYSEDDQGNVYIRFSYYYKDVVNYKFTDTINVSILQLIAFVYESRN